MKSLKVITHLRRRCVISGCVHKCHGMPVLRRSCLQHLCLCASMIAVVIVLFCVVAGTLEMRRMWFPQRVQGQNGVQDLRRVWRNAGMYACFGLHQFLPSVVFAHNWFAAFERCTSNRSYFFSNLWWLGEYKLRNFGIFQSRDCRHQALGLFVCLFVCTTVSDQHLNGRVFHGCVLYVQGRKKSSLEEFLDPFDVSPLSRLSGTVPARDVLFQRADFSSNGTKARARTRTSNTETTSRLSLYSNGKLVLTVVHGIISYVNIGTFAKLSYRLFYQMARKVCNHKCKTQAYDPRLSVVRLCPKQARTGQFVSVNRLHSHNATWSARCRGRQAYTEKTRSTGQRRNCLEESVVHIVSSVFQTAYETDSFYACTKRRCECMIGKLFPQRNGIQKTEQNLGSKTNFYHWFKTNQPKWIYVRKRRNRLIVDVYRWSTSSSVNCTFPIFATAHKTHRNVFRSFDEPGQGPLGIYPDESRV